MIEFTQVNRGGNDFAIHRKNGFEQTCQTSRFQGVADIGLHAADRDPMPQIGLLVEVREGLCFGGVSDLRAGGVGFDVLNFFRADVTIVCPLNGEQLSFTTRCPKTLAATIGRYSDSANNTPDPISICQGFIERLDDKGDVAFGTDKAVGGLIEWSRAGCAARLGLGKEN